MALKIRKKLENGIEVINSYMRVENITVSKTKMSFNCSYYVNDLVNSSFHSEFKECGYVLEGTNPLHQAYCYLKTLEEFKDAEDC